jgi:hypothetical protein
MNLVQVCQLIQGLNAELDAGGKADLKETKARIADGSLFDWLASNYPSIDVSVMRDLDRRDGGVVLEGLQQLLGGYAGEERRKWGVEHNGLCLLVAWVTELIQQDDLRKRSDLK